MNRRLPQRILLAMTVAAAVALPMVGCRPTLPAVVADDAGNESFVRQVVPITQGRKIRGYDEVKLLSDLVALTSRETVLRALMQQPDYVEHWSEVLVDDLRVHREGSREQSSCYGPPLRAGAVTDSLAQSVMSSAPTTAINPDFNMSDLLRSALKLDNLYPAYTGHLFAMENKPGFDTESAMRGNLGSTFGQAYVHREMLCLTCHNSEYSLSGEASGWDRTHPISGYFERALYGSASGEPTDDAFAMFRTDVLAGVPGGSSPVEPWGLTGCGSFDQTVPNDPQGETANFAGLMGQQVSIFNVRSRLASGYNGLAADGLQRSLPPDVAATCEFCADSCAGATLDVAAVANGATNAATVKTLLTNTVWSGGNKCIDCHGGSAGLNLATTNDWANELIGVTATETFNGMAIKRVEPGNANNSYLIKKLENAAGITPSRMPLSANPLSVTQINQIKAWINDMPVLTACGVCPVTDCAQPRRHVAGNEAFAYLTAANIVNNLWAEAMGAPLTIANYFPRNASEQQALWHLTEYRFIPEDWSPQAVLARALTSNYFNRKAPQSSALPSPYAIPPLLDPWIVADPRVPPVSDPGYVAADHPDNHYNAMGEGVYRYSARSLLNSIHESLDWPQPQRFPPPSGYADQNLQRAMGQYFSDTSPGSRGTDLQGLLFWESVHGACTKPAGVSVDWIDRVVTAANGFSPASPGGPLTVEDLVVVLRDWLLGYGGIGSGAPVGMSGSEASALASYFGIANLSDPASTVSNLESKLRGYCGVLAETPQFMLAGITPTGAGPKPRLRVCNGTPCSYQELCNELVPAFNSQDIGGTLICGEASVSILPPIQPPDKIWVDWCIGPGCGLLVDFVPKGCFPDVLRGNPATALSCPVEPPACDVRCSRIDCCGGPSPPLAQRGERPLVVAWAEGARVAEARGVKIRSHEGEKFEELKPGSRLQYGDLIAIPAGAQLSFKGELASFRTPERGLPESIPNGMLFLSITGEPALQRRAAPEGMAKLPLEHIQRVQKGWASRGEAGPPLSYEQYKSYRYPREELPPVKERPSRQKKTQRRGPASTTPPPSESPRQAGPAAE